MTRHIPVLLQELVESLDIQPGEVVVDATLGGGGHARAVFQNLKGKGYFVGLDLDGTVIKNAKTQAPNSKGLHVELVHGNFKNIKQIIGNLGLGEVDSIYADLGFSSDQLDKEQSFQKPGELDLRIDKSLGVKAKDLINGLYKKELEELFRVYADERFANDFATEIVKVRDEKTIKTKQELAKIIDDTVSKLKGKKGKIRENSKARIFQALRIAVNDEMNNLQQFLPAAFDMLKQNGRLAVISFHSGEDRLVKRFMKELVKIDQAEWIEELIVPKSNEVRRNSRASSAKLRVIKKLR